MEGFRGFINPCHISAEEEYALLIRPFLFSSPPSCLGYHRPRNTPRAARLQAATGRDWFVGWMGQLSFLLGHFKGKLQIFVPKVTMTANEKNIFLQRCLISN